MSAEMLSQTGFRRENEPKSTENALIVFGRGVARDSHGVWHPTPLTELLSGAGHSGMYNPCPDPTDPKTTIGGANANALAAYHELASMNEEGQMPSVVIFAAGRPPYLQNAPSDLSEGSVLRDKIYKRLQRDDIALPEAITLTQNTNTTDDVVDHLLF